MRARVSSGKVARAVPCFARHDAKIIVKRGRGRPDDARAVGRREGRRRDDVGSDTAGRDVSH